jgi:hypothetical protein
LKKDDDLAKTIEVNKVGYAKPFKFTWNFTFGIIDPPRVRDIKRWKLCVSTMNKKWFMVGKFINI